MFGLDELIAGYAGGESLLVVLGVALLLGLRHAADPDHLVAVSTLVATTPDGAARRATTLGASWGFGHATTLVVLGAPIALYGSSLPEVVARAAEALVGVVIALLAIRLLRRWRAGAFHAHTHTHDELVHRHLHDHARDLVGHRHGHDHVLVRSPAQAYAIGLVHGVGGSAGLGVLLLVSISNRMHAFAALLAFALAAAVSMTTLSAAIGYALGRPVVERRMLQVVPALGTLSLLFGSWYALAAFGAVG